MFAFVENVRYRLVRAAGEIRSFLKHAEILGVRYALGAVLHQDEISSECQDLGSAKVEIRDLARTTCVNEINAAAISTNGRCGHRRPVDDFPGIGGAY